MITEVGTSLCCYASTFVLCHVLRLLLRRTLPQSSYQYAVEFVDTFHMICCLYENGMVIQEGLVPFGVALFTLAILYSFLLEGFANPAVIVHYVLIGKLTVFAGVARVIIELLAGVAAYRYTVSMWAGVAPSPKHYHAALVDMLAENCSTGLNVSPFEGFLFEMLATVVIQMVAAAFYGGRRFWRFINAITSVFIVIYGLNYTGALLNPILGFAVGWGCKDYSAPSHMLVYWLGPIVGIIVGDLLGKQVFPRPPKGLHTGGAVKNGAVREQNGKHEKIH